jgi:hypothetical protein
MFIKKDYLKWKDDFFFEITCKYMERIAIKWGA